MSVQIGKSSNRNLCIRFPYNELLVAKAKSIPIRKWDKKNKVWDFPAIGKNIEYVLKWFPDAEWSSAAKIMAEQSDDRKQQRHGVIATKKRGSFDNSIFAGFPFKKSPFHHQKIALALGWDCENFAYLMEPGTGKTFVAINDAAHNWLEGNIQGMIVICPNSVKSHWYNPYSPGFDEISRYMPGEVPVNAGMWKSTMRAKEKEAYAAFTDQWGKTEYIHILVVNVEAMHVRRVYEECIKFATAQKTMVVVDESTRIKNRATKRSKNITKLRDFCVMARIMTGTPVIQSPLDAYAQFRFMDPEILGFSTYREFESHYAVKGGYENYQILEYKNLPDLTRSMATASYIIKKEDCLDLPPKIFSERHLSMTEDQLAAYNQMAEISMVLLEEEDAITAPIVLVQLLRLQQLTSGYLPIKDGEIEFAGNPKTEEVLEIIKERDHKIIVWSRFVPEIEFLSNRLNEEGIDNFKFYGATKPEKREEYMRRFLDREDKTNVFIGQTRTGGIGIELYTAQTVIFLSNTFSAEDRIQAEDRAHRKGTEHPVEYIDIMMGDTVDGHIIETVRGYIDVSKKVMEEGFKSWVK